MNNLILIDINLEQNNVLINSFLPDSIYFNYDYTSTSDDVYNFLLNNNITHIERICLIFASDGPRPVNFINNSPLFIPSDIDALNLNKSENFNLIINLLNTLQPEHIDFLACNLLKYSSYTNYFQSIIDISTNKNLLVGASSDRTGNIKYGGDWVLENTKENIQNIYFNSNITNYTQLLDFNMYINTNVLSLESLDKDINGNYIDENGDIVENRIPTGKYQIQSWGNSAGGGDSIPIATLGLDVNITMVCSTFSSSFAALTTNGNVIVWGDPYSGGSSVYGDDTYRGFIYTGNGINNGSGNGSKLAGVVKIYSTYGAFAALLDDSSVFVWGSPVYGGSSVWRDPQNPQNPIDRYRGYIYDGDGINNGTGNGSKLTGVVKIYSTSFAFAALLDDGGVFVWGSPVYGGSIVFGNPSTRGYIYTGDGTNSNSKLTGVEKIYSNGYAFAALLDDKSVFVWGSPRYGGSSVFGNATNRGFIYTGNGINNGSGGNGTKLTGVVKIYSTFVAFAALLADKSVFVWGDPFSGGKLQIYIDADNNPTITPLSVKPNYKKFIFATNNAFCEMAQYDNNRQIPYYVKTIGDYPKGISQDTLIYAVDNNISISCNNL